MAKGKMANGCLPAIRAERLAGLDNIPPIEYIPYVE
jgi:hypothetical protein